VGSTQIITSSITTRAIGAFGAFATDSGSAVTFSKVIIQARDGAHSVMANNGSSLTLTDVVLDSAGQPSLPHSIRISSLPNIISCISPLIMP
jgi:hypothetical protein